MNLRLKVLKVVGCLILGFGMEGTAKTALIDRGLFDADGVPGGPSVRLVYDTDLNITWLGDANFAQTSGFDADGEMTWQNAKNWATSLSVGGLTGWRLPTTMQPDASCSQQWDGGAFGLQGNGFDCTGSEMGHLANVEGISSASPGPFSNVIASGYWSSTDYAPDTDAAWIFFYSNLGQSAQPKTPLPRFA